MVRPEFGINRDTPITFIELPPTSGGNLNGRRMDDVYSGLNLPPRAIPLLHAIAKQEGFRDVISIAPQYNPGTRLTPENWQRIVDSGVLALSSVTRTISQTAELARLYKKANPTGIVIVGGLHVSSLPEEGLGFADIVVRGEGEETLRELLTALEETGSPRGVRGVSYREGGAIVHEPSRALLSEQQLAELPLPVYSEEVARGVKIHTTDTSRGCPNDCNYCLVNIFYGDRYRRKSNEVIMEGLRALPFGPTFIIDDNFAGRPGETRELLGMMKDAGLGKDRSFTVQLRAQAGLMRNFASALRPAGIRVAAIGIESLFDDTLEGIGKNTTVEQIEKGIGTLREEGVWIHGMFMIGLDEDTPDRVREILEWAKNHVDTAQFFAPVPLPGTPFAQEMEAQGRILSKYWPLYDGQNVLIRPKHFSPIELQQTIYGTYGGFYDYNIGVIRTVRSVFGWVPPNNRSRGRDFRDIAKDWIARHHAHKAVDSYIRDPQTQRYLAELKAAS